MKAALEGGQFEDLFRDLHSEFPSGAKDQNLDRVQMWLREFNGWNPEGGSFSGAGLRLADNVMPGKNDRDRFCLNRRGLFVAESVDCLK